MCRVCNCLHSTAVYVYTSVLYRERRVGKLLSFVVITDSARIRLFGMAGRGRGKTLPAWMTRGNAIPAAGPAENQSQQVSGPTDLSRKADVIDNRAVCLTSSFLTLEYLLIVAAESGTGSRHATCSWAASVGWRSAEPRTIHATTDDTHGFCYAAGDSF